MIPSLIGWLGVFVGMCVNLPQVWRLYKTHETAGLAIGTYRLLAVATCCYFIKAVSIGEPVFIVSNSVVFLTSLAVLYLHWRCPRGD